VLATMTPQSFSDRLRGIHAATIVPMTSDFQIDEPALAAHITSVASVPGMNGLLVNGHAGENFVFTLAEKLRVVKLACK
jgi:4-hydroxy-tetrahydrodipicolinate synthase